MSNARTINIGLCGLGTVGQGVWKHFSRLRSDLEARLGTQVNITRAAVRDLKKARGFKVPASRLTTDALSVAASIDNAPQNWQRPTPRSTSSAS